MIEKNKEEMDANRPIKLFGIILPSLPMLILRFGGTFLRFKLQSKEGGRIFQKGLIKQGVDKDTAEVFKEIYLQPSQLKQYISLLR